MLLSHSLKTWYLLELLCQICNRFIAKHFFKAIYNLFAVYA